MRNVCDMTDILAEDIKFFIDVSDVNFKTKIQIISKSYEEAESLKSQIIQWKEKASYRDVIIEQFWFREIIEKGSDWYKTIKEKAEKYDTYIHHTTQLELDSESLQQKIKELENQNQLYCDIYDESQKIKDENQQLKQKIEKIKIESEKYHNVESDKIKRILDEAGKEE